MSTDHWLHGDWRVQFNDDEFGWVQGTAQVDLSSVTLTGTGRQDLPPASFSIQYSHPRLGTIQGQVTAATLDGDRLSVQLAPVQATTSDVPGVPGVQRIPALPSADFSVAVAGETRIFLLESVVAPATRLTLEWKASLHIAEGIWSQDLEDDQISRFGTRNGHVDSVAMVSYGSEVWARPSPLVVGIAVPPPATPGGHLDPASTPHGIAARTLWIAGFHLPAQPTLEVAQPFATSAWTILSASERSDALTATRWPDSVGLEVATVDVSWGTSAQPSEGSHELAFDGTRVRWPLKWGTWDVGLLMYRDSSSVPGQTDWRPADRVWPFDDIVVELLPPTGVTYGTAVQLKVRSLSPYGDLIEEQLLSVGANQLRSPTLRLKPVGDPGPGLPVDPLGDLEVRFDPDPPGINPLRVLVDGVPAANDTRWDRLLRRSANVWGLSSPSSTEIVDTSVVPIQLRDHAAMLHLQNTFTHLLHRHAAMIEAEPVAVWQRRLREMVQPRALAGGSTTTPPLATTSIAGPDGSLVEISVFGQTPEALAALLGIPVSRAVAWWSWGLEEARRAYVRSVRSTRASVMAIVDDDVRGLLSLVAVAGGEPAETASLRLVKWDGVVGRVVDDRPAQAVLTSLRTLGAHATAMDELDGVVLAIVGATVAVLTGGIAYFVAAPAVAAGAIVVGVAVDATLLAIDLQRWAEEDWEVEVAGTGVVVVGMESYQRAAASQTPAWLRGVSIAATILGPLLDGAQLFAKTAQVSRQTAAEIASRVLRSGASEETIRGLSQAERLGLVRFLDDALRRIDDGVDIARLTDLERRAVSWFNSMGQLGPRALTGSAVRPVVGSVSLADGGLLQLASAGRCSRCSLCMTLELLYEGILARNPTLATRLAELQDALTGINRLLDPTDAHHRVILDEAAALSADLAAEAATMFGPGITTLVPLHQACRRVVDRGLYDYLVASDQLLAEAVGAQASRGNRRLALTIMRALGRPARIGETQTLLEVLEPTARSGLRRLLQLDGDYALIAAWITKWTRTKSWRLGNPESLNVLLTRIDGMSQVHLEGLRALFRAGSQDLLQGARARSFVRSFLDAAERLFDAQQAALFDDMLEVLGQLAARSDGLARIATMFASVTDNIFESVLFQALVATRRLQELGGQAHAVFEVVAAHRRIDVVIYDSAGPAARVLLEIETKAHNSLRFIHSISTMRQWVEDILRVANDPSRVMSSLQWAFSNGLLSAQPLASAMDYLRFFFRSPFTAEGRQFVQSLPGDAGEINAVLAMIDGIDQARRAELLTQLDASIGTIVRLD